MNSLLDQSSVFDENKDWLSELVGEGKKYKDQNALAKAYGHLDYLDSNLKEENRQLREDYLELRKTKTAEASLQEMIDQIKQQPPSSSEQPLAKELDNKPAYDPRDVESLIDRRLTEREASRKEQDNFNKVKDKLVENWGPNYQTRLNREAQSLAISNVDDIARRSPDLLINALGLNQKPSDTFQAPPGSSERFVPKGALKRTWTYYQDLKKKDPVAYFSPQTTRQMAEDYRSLGRDFEDGDFRRFAPTYDV